MAGRCDGWTDTGTPEGTSRQSEVLTLQMGMGTPMRTQMRAQGTHSYESVIHYGSFEGVFRTDTVGSVFRTDTVEGAIWTYTVEGVAWM